MVFFLVGVTFAFFFLFFFLLELVCSKKRCFQKKNILIFILFFGLAILRDAPFQLLNFGIYEISKKWQRQWLQYRQTQAGMLLRLLSLPLLPLSCPLLSFFAPFSLFIFVVFATFRP